jgi:hypothetical protein
MTCPRRSTVLVPVFLALAIARPLTAQGVAAVDVPIEEARVREVLGYLASDRLAGRDSPSPGQREAALYLAWNFARAGLSPVAGKSANAAPSWFHRYAVPGFAFDGGENRAWMMVGDSERELLPFVEFRLWETGRAFTGGGFSLAPTAATTTDSPEQRRDLSARSLRLFEVDTTSPVWLAADRGRQIISRRLAGSAPRVLLARGLAPAGATFRFEFAAPRELAVPLENVMAWLPGTTRADEFVIVCAHYDHIGIAPSVGDRDAINNGADDDATGTTAVLLLAEHFARQATRPSRSLLFVAFSAEEKGLRGSAAFVADPPVPLEKIAAVVNLEMLGRPEPDRSPYVWITGKDYSDFATIAGEALVGSGVEMSDFAMARQLFGASDNFPFARAGVVAHSISAGSLHRDYHRPSDETERIDHAHMTAVIGGIARVVAAFADRDAVPVWNDAGREAIRSGR